MNATERITHALKHVPSDIASTVLQDINKRISDWRSAGGNDDDPYIEQQVRYAERIGWKYSQKQKGDDQPCPM